jgi:hypothetical protein
VSLIPTSGTNQSGKSMQPGDLLKSSKYVKFLMKNIYYQDFICIALEVKPFKDGESIPEPIGWSSQMVKPGEKRIELNHLDYLVTIFFNDEIYSIICNVEDFEVISRE